MQFVKQRAAADAEGFGGFGAVEIVVAQRLENGLPFDFTEPLSVGRLGQWGHDLGALPYLGRQVFGQNQFAPRKQRGTLHGIAQLTNIAGPGIARQAIGQG